MTNISYKVVTYVANLWPDLTRLRSVTEIVKIFVFQVKVLKHGKTNYKLKLTVDIHQGRFFAVKPNKDNLDSSNMFSHDKSKHS